jgi:hypothetical protein
MTDGTAGWFRDPNDPSLARWHDGERWTEHTLVIADQAPGVEPPPPVTAEPTPTAWDTPATTTFSAPTAAAPAVGGGRRPLPTWAMISAPVSVIAVVALGFLLTHNGDVSDDTKTETAGTEVATLDAAVNAARRAGLTEEISDARAAALIEQICDAAESPSKEDELGQQLGNLPATTPTELRAEVSALGAGAEERCPDALKENPDLIDDLSDAAVVAFSTTTTAPTVLPGDGSDTTVAGTDGGTGTGTGTGTAKGGKTTTTKKGSTATTARPTTTTTIRAGSLGSSCSSEGATGYTSDGRQRVCTRQSCASGNTKLVWDLSARKCQSTTTTVTDSVPPVPTVPTTSPNTSTTT